MPKPPQPPRSLRSIDEDLVEELVRLVRRTAAALAPETVPDSPAAALAGTPEQMRAADLARLTAVEVLRRALDEHASMLALGLGRRREAPVTYADLGAAVGITRQSARTRWPAAIPDARPGRPRTAPQEQEPAPADPPDVATA